MFLHDVQIRPLEAVSLQEIGVQMDHEKES